MDSFYLHLQSNASSRNFKENTLTDFRNEIVPPLELESNAYECALVDVSYVYSEPVIHKGTCLYSVRYPRTVFISGEKCSLSEAFELHQDIELQEKSLFKVFCAKYASFQDLLKDGFKKSTLAVRYSQFFLGLPDWVLGLYDVEGFKGGSYDEWMSSIPDTPEFERPKYVLQMHKDIIQFKELTFCRMPFGLCGLIAVDYEELGNLSVEYDEDSWLVKLKNEDEFDKKGLDGPRTETRTLEWDAFKEACGSKWNSHRTSCKPSVEVEFEYYDYILKEDLDVYKIDKWMMRVLPKTKLENGFVKMEMLKNGPLELITLEPIIEEVLGLTEYIIEKENGKYVKKAAFPFDKQHGSRQIFLYTDLIDFVHVGNTTAPLLRTFKYDGEENRQMVVGEFNHLQYKPIIKETVQEIHIYLRNEMNRPPSIMFGSFAVTLHVRRKM